MISDIKPYPSAEIFNNKHRRRSVGLTGRPSFCPKFIEESGILYFLFHAVFISLDHLLDHLSADRAGLLRAKAPKLLTTAVFLPV